MDATTQTYSNRSNARKAALRQIETGKAPATSFDIDKTDGARFEVMWNIVETPAQPAEAPAGTPAETAQPEDSAEPKAKRSRKQQTADGQAKPPTGQRAAARPAAQQGTLPQQPDFTANTHKPYRKRLAVLVALVEAGNLEGLRAVEMLPPRSSSPKALHRYRDLAIIALKARAN
jgi:hypothetical protein